MILTWGSPRDRPIARVTAALRERGVQPLFVDQTHSLLTDVELTVDGDVSGRLAIDGRVFDLRSVTAAYLRPCDWRRLPDLVRLGAASPAWLHVLRCHDLLWTWAEVTPVPVVNRPLAMGSSSSKPYQSTIVKSAGFAVPETLITTDPRAIEEFWSRHRAVVYKSISGVRSIVSRLTADHRGRLGDVAHCPTQFQEYVAGTDYRVHVVGDDTFCATVVSPADDYRYATRQGGSVEIRPGRLPDDCTERCRFLARRMRLSVAGIDLRLTPDGVWYCFEVNSSPAFTYYDHEPEQPITLAVARLLEDLSTGRRNG